MNHRSMKITTAGATTEQSMFGFLQVRKGRRAAVRMLGPFVERSRQRLTRIPESVWLDPYMVGFICTVITDAAKRETDSMGTESLALVQSQAWAEITGLSADIIGEEISFLSTGRSEQFLNGCRKAAWFVEALHAPSDDQLQDSRSPAWLTDLDLGSDTTRSGEDAAPTPYVEAGAPAYGSTPDELWACFFDTALAGISRYAVQPRSL